MSSVNQRTRTTIRHEYYVANPAMWADVKEAMAYAARDRDAKDLSNKWDDVIQVTHDDENIIVFWEEQA